MKSKNTDSGLNAKKLTWYQRFGLFFFTRARVTILLWVLLASFGATAYTTLLQREGFPDVAAPYGLATGTYLVNDANKVDQEVVSPLVKAVEATESVNKVSSAALPNAFNLQIEFKEGTDPAEGTAQVQRAAQDVQLPQSANVQFNPLFVSKLTEEGDDVLISVSSSTLGTEALQTRAENVAAALRDNGETSIEQAQRVQVVDAFQRGIDPVTGQERATQEKFDWIAMPEGEGIAFANSALVAVQAKPGTDILELDDSIQQSLQALRDNPLFSDVQLHVAADFATGVRDQTSSLQSNLLGGLIAVVLVSFLLISFRASLIAALTMTTVLAITVGLMYAFGLTLNVITLFSLILCLGLIVDDSMIVTEAIDNARRKGLKGREAVATALRKITLASVAGTLTTILGFAPLLFIGGILGDFIRAIPITLTISLVVSLVLSLSLIPFLARFLMLRGEVKPVRNPIAKLEAAAGHGLAQLIRRATRSRVQGAFIGLSAIALSFAMLVGGMMYMGKLEFNIFPAAKDSNALIANISFNTESIDEARATSAQINDVVASELGDQAVRVSYWGSATDKAATMVIDLVRHQDREEKAPKIAERIQERLNTISGASVEVKSDSAGPPEGDFVVQIKDENDAKATRLATAVQAFLETEMLERRDGTTAAFTKVTVDGEQTILRADGDRYLQVEGALDATDISALVILAQDAVKSEFPAERLEREFGLPADAIDFNVGAEAENQESFQGMVIAFPILILAMYILLAVQFRSFSQPLMIFLAIPFSLFGVGAGLFYTDNPFSFFTMLAIFALLGISVNNTILLTAYANQARQAGMGRIDAMASAIEERFRPLLATSITTVVALVPLALTDPFWESLAVTLIFGMLSSTFLVVVAFPYFYLGNELIRMRFNRWYVLAWLAIFVAGIIGLSMSANELASPFAGLYLLATIVYLVVQAIRRRKRRKAKKADN